LLYETNCVQKSVILKVTSCWIVERLIHTSWKLKRSKLFIWNSINKTATIHSIAQDEMCILHVRKHSKEGKRKKPYFVTSVAYWAKVS
jgi:hypothetical protein